MSQEVTYVYVIALVAGVGEFAAVKVGIAKNPEHRLAQLKTGSPFEMDIACVLALPNRDMALGIEQSFHKLNAEQRLKGEWFDLHPVEAVRRVCGFVEALIYLLEDEELYELALQKTGVSEVLRVMATLDRPDGVTIQ